MNDLIAYASASTGLLAVVGTMLAKWLDAKVKNESRLREQLLGRIQDLEARLIDSTDKISRLELTIMSKTFEMRELTIKYEALKVNYEDLDARYKASEETARKLLEKLVTFTGEQKIRSLTPSAFDRPQPHMVTKK